MSEHKALDSEGKKTVLLIGNLTQEGVTTKINTLGYRYRNKLLVSTPRNWETIVEIIRRLRENGNLVAVFVHFTPAAIFRAAHPDYEEVWECLLEELAAAGALIFVYEDNLAGEFSRDSFLDGPYRDPISESEAAGLIRELYDNDVEVVPYKRRTDLTLRIQQTLDEIEGGIFLRLYVPRGRLQAEQLTSLMRLLENYLQQVEGISFSYNQRNTAHGTIYEFKSPDGSVNTENLGDALTRFEEFMSLVENDAPRAMRILESLSIDSSEAVQLVTRYARDCRRLRMDIRHEYETKLLALRQRLESEALELSFDEALSPSQVLRPALLFSEPLCSSPITIVNADFAQIVQGDITYNAEDSQLIELFEEYAEGLEALTLRTSLDQLKDESVPEEERQTAKQRIEGFLLRILPKIGEKAVEVLLGYLVRVSMGG